VTRFNTNFSETFPFSDTAINILMAASTAIAYTVPGNANQIYRATFSVSSSADVFVKLNGTAVVPVSNTVTSTPNQERINPFDPHRYVKGGDTLSFISTGTPQVSVSLLLVQDAV
jgi:hypothetical protein